MAELPDHVVAEILLRLPVKSILRFRSVSKTFCALIDSNRFIKHHLNLSIQTKTTHILTLLHYDNIFLRSISLYSLDRALKLVPPTNHHCPATELLGSCNGLICLYYEYFDEIIVWNPATRKHVKFSPADIVHPFKDDGSPENMDIIYGFGYNYVSDDYKVVMVVQFVRYDEPVVFYSEVNVYSLRSGSWTKKRGFPNYLLNGRKGSGAFLCGKLHWVVSKHECEAEYDFDLVLAFDLVTEESRTLILPDFSSDVTDMFVSELGGCLSILCNYDDVGVADMWVMKDYGVRESWTKLVTVSESGICRPLSYLFPLAYSESGDDVLMILNFGEFFWFNLEKKKVKFVDVCALPDFFRPVICLPSLVSLGWRAENDVKEGGDKQEKQGKGKNDPEGEFLSVGFKLVL